jgi:thioredoxin reductase
LTWSLLGILILVLGLAALLLLHRRSQLRMLRATLEERSEAKAIGSHKARLQYPLVDLSRCVGCGTCVTACPEEGVLGLVYGQAAVVHGARCVGHGRCAEACPVGAIQVTLGDLSKRDDIPVLSDDLEASGVPGLYLAGEVTGYALVRTAITHGAAVAAHVAQRVGQTAPAKSRSDNRHGKIDNRHTPSGGLDPKTAGTLVLEEHPEPEILDLLIVGAGPAGLSCSLAAKQHGLRFVTLEQEEIGGTVAKYPRRKLVMTQPVELPLHGKLKRTSYQKEELIELWQEIAAKHQLPIQTGEQFRSLEQDADGVFTVQADATYRARNVCLCLGRRGTPRKLGVPGEDLPKVAYSLMDAESYRDRRILVVGGGDSAIEAAVGLAEQPGNQVHLSYRKAEFFRIKARNRRNLERSVEAGRLQVLFESQVQSIEADRVILSGNGGPLQLPNDEVFVFAGGIPPFDLLQQAGISFDPAERPPTVELGERGTGIFRALSIALLLALATLAFGIYFRDYYGLSPQLRPQSEWHVLLRPTGLVGLGAGIAAVFLILMNLVYLLRRSRLGEWIAGSLQHWLSIHVVTGILALLLLVVHSGMEVRNTPGGHALLAVAILVASGAIGRYFYAFLPKAANGQELSLEQVRSSLTAILGEWDRHGRGLSAAVRAELDTLLDHKVWRSSLPRRILGLLGSRRRLRKSLKRIEATAGREGVARSQVRRVLALARRIHRTSMMTQHYEDLRGLVASWRFVHRWLALAMVLLAVLHILVALRYARFG